MIKEIRAGFKKVDETKGAERKTVALSGAIFGLLSVYFYFTGKVFLLSLGGAAGALFFLSLLGGLKTTTPVYRMWMKLSIVMGAVVSRVLLTIIFYLVITPVALVKKGKSSSPFSVCGGKTASNWQRRSNLFDNYTKKY